MLAYDMRRCGANGFFVVGRSEIQASSLSGWAGQTDSFSVVGGVLCVFILANDIIALYVIYDISYGTNTVELRDRDGGLLGECKTQCVPIGQLLGPKKSRNLCGLKFGGV